MAGFEAGRGTVERILATRSATASEQLLFVFPASFKVSLFATPFRVGITSFSCGRSNLALFSQGFWPLAEDLESLVTTRPAWQTVALCTASRRIQRPCQFFCLRRRKTCQSPRSTEAACRKAFPAHISGACVWSYTIKQNTLTTCQTPQRIAP